MSALPVADGTAEALAVAAHLETLTDTLRDDAEDIRRIWRVLIGRVDNPRHVYDSVREDALHLWWLIAADWADEDLDPLPDLPKYDGIPPDHAELERLQLTVDRLTMRIELTVHVARQQWADRYRITGWAA